MNQMVGERLRKNTKLTVASLLVLSFVAGASSALVTGNASAEQNHGSKMAWNGGWGGHNDNAESALVVDAFETYMARPHILDSLAQPAMDSAGIDQLQVVKLKVRGDLAYGKVDNGTTYSYFLAHKDQDKDVWQVFFTGTAAPDQATIDQYKVPQEWLQPEQ